MKHHRRKKNPDGVGVVAIVVGGAVVLGLGYLIYQITQQQAQASSGGGSSSSSGGGSSVAGDLTAGTNAVTTGINAFSNALNPSGGGG